MECKIRDISLYYEEVGSGRPLLMLHGWPTDHRHMVADMEPLFAERAGWRRIYPDLPGMGRTPGAKWITLQDHILDVVMEFIDAVAPGERFTVAGTSYGGYLARGVVHRRGEQMNGLMLTVPVIEANMPQRDLPTHRVLREDAEFLAALRPDEQDTRGMVVAQSMAVLEALRKFIAPAVGMADHEFLNRLHEHYAFTFDVDALPEPFPAPTLILTGRFDHWCGYRQAYRILDNYPRGTFAVLDCAGHALGVEQLTLFKALTGEWLDRVEEYALKQTNAR